jgi:hypothetical protein
LEVVYARKLEARFGRNQAPSRYVVLPSDLGGLDGSICRVEGQAVGEGLISWGLVLESQRDPAYGFAVLISSAGRVEVRAVPATGKDVPYPVVKPTTHPAIRKGAEVNELGVVLKGRTMRVFVNGAEVVPAQELPEGYSSLKPLLAATISSRQQCTVTFHHFRRWKWPEKPALAKEWPDDLAEVMKGKPDIDDDFSDQKKSPFDPLRTFGSMQAKRAELEYRYAKEGFVVAYGRQESASVRFGALPHKEGGCGDFVCRAVGQVASEADSWGLYLAVGDDGTRGGDNFVVRLWGDGSVEIGASPFTGAKADYPVLERTARHRAVRKAGQPNELGVAVKGCELRVFVNGAEVVPARPFPRKYARSVQFPFYFHADEGPGTITFHSFKRWKLPEAKKEAKALTPADLEKLKPVIDDDFSDPKGGALTPPETEKLKRTLEKAGIDVATGKGDGYVVDLKPIEGTQPRKYWARHREGKSDRFACRLMGRVKSDGRACWGLILQGEPGLVFFVRVWNTGEIDTVRSDGSKRLDFDYPRLEATAHKAIRKGDKENELVVIAEGGKMSLFVNGERVCEPLDVPREFAEMDHGLFAEKPDRRQAARFAFGRFTLWKLPSR